MYSADSWPKPYILFYTMQHVPLHTDELCGLISRVKNGVGSFTLPFGPAMNEQHILLADGLRNCTAPVYGKSDGDAWKAQPVQYDGAKMYKVWGNLFDQDGPELVQGTVADTAYAVGIVSYADLKGLRDNTCVTDGIINALSNYFHRNELFEMNGKGSRLQAHSYHEYLLCGKIMFFWWATPKRTE